MKYRQEVDGLRAIAVVPVVLFHAGLSFLQGGFTGVDIFFVISGYLITSLLIDELVTNKFSIIGFYERRACRILPALVTLAVFTTLLAYLIMPVKFFLQYCQSLAAVTLFSSNIYFYLTSGYFSLDADEKPLLHTWSLAVEEQYYIFFPLLLAFLWRFGKKNLIIVLLILTVLSLGTAEYRKFSE
jgi:peptidoglycan/LPS O-acetylase OafA/YrhL